MSADQTKLSALLDRVTADDIRVALAYTTMLKMSLVHPVRLKAGDPNGILCSMRDYLAMILGQDTEWVQTAFEERAREFA